MQVKRFLFPLFDEWIRTESWSGTVGAFHCSIEMVISGNDHVTYGFAISVNNNPLNVYAPKIFYRAYQHPINEGLANLRVWYEQTVLEAHDAWQAYLLSYFVSDAE